MMRIVCPTCGEEPRKGERHVCRPPATPESSPSAPESSPRVAPDRFQGPGSQGPGIQRRAGQRAPASAVCASVASLVAKNPELRRSWRALARSPGDAFVAGLLAAAVALPGWHRDPKRALLTVLVGQVAEEAARAVQGFWRQRLEARRPRGPPRVCQGFLQLEAPAPRRPLGRALAAAGGDIARAPGRRPPSLGQATPQRAASPTPRGETPRGRSNPRPTGTRAVPMNPIQALKMRREQQEREAEERKYRDAKEALGKQLAGAGVPAPAEPPSPLAAGLGQPLRRSASEEALQALEHSMAMHVGGGQELPSPRHDAVAYAQPPSEPATPRGQSCGADLTRRPLLPPSGSMFGKEARGEPAAPPERRPPRSNGAAPTPPRSPRQPRAPATDDGEEATSAPATLSTWPAPPPAAAPPADDTPRASSACAASAATERLRQRLRQRDGGGATPVGRAARAGAAEDWRDRIEARRREVEMEQSVEQQQKELVAERSGRRNEAMRRVLERQAQRQQEVVGLEE